MSFRKRTCKWKARPFSMPLFNCVKKEKNRDCTYSEKRRPVKKEQRQTQNESYVCKYILQFRDAGAFTTDLYISELLPHIVKTLPWPWVNHPEYIYWNIEVTQSCPTLCNPMDYTYSPPGSSVDGILQAGILEWGCHVLLQGIFPTQGSNPDLPHCEADTLPSEPPGKPLAEKL